MAISKKKRSEAARVDAELDELFEILDAFGADWGRRLLYRLDRAVDGGPDRVYEAVAEAVKLTFREAREQAALRKMIGKARTHPALKAAARELAAPRGHG
jgi:hypothetical protein